MIFIYFDGFGCSSAEGVDVSVAGIRSKAYLVYMASVTGNRFSGNGCKTVSMSGITASADLGTACNLVYVLFGMAGMIIFNKKSP